MRRIVMFNWVSIDGFFAGPDGEMDWIVRDPEVDRALRETGGAAGEVATPDTMLLGNTTYTLFENTWPHIAKDQHAPAGLRQMADEVTRMTKVVFSRTRKEVTWDNSVLLRGDPATEVKALKQNEGPDMMIFGSGTIVRRLADEGLIDEYVLAVTPIVLGKGKALFDDVSRLNLNLSEARHFASGNVLLRYALPKA